MNRYWMLVPGCWLKQGISFFVYPVSSIQYLLGKEHELTFPDKIDNPKIFF
jgi:hypothetical protein